MLHAKDESYTVIVKKAWIGLIRRLSRAVWFTISGDEGVTTQAEHLHFENSPILLQYYHSSYVVCRYRTSQKETYVENVDLPETISFHQRTVFVVLFSTLGAGKRDVCLKGACLILRKICSNFLYLVQRGPTDNHVSIIPPWTFIALCWAIACHI